MIEYMNIADKIIDFLYRNQVIVENQQLLFKLFQDGYRSKLCCRFIRNDDDEYVIPVCLLAEEEGFSLAGSFTENKKKVHEGNIFRLNQKGLSHGVCPTDYIRPHLSRSLESRGKEIGYLLLVKRIYWSLLNNLKKTGYFDFALKYALRKHLSPKKDSSIRLEDHEGFSFVFEKAEKVPEGIRVTLKSYDLGGIYDDNLNSEGLYYPPQVPGNYYADAYAAYLFLNRYTRCKDRKFLDAGLLALDFIKRTYPRYQAANIVWHHSDFKNPVIIESICEMLPKVAPEKSAQYTELLGLLKKDSYEPTNIYALRLHTYAAKKRNGIKRNIFEKWIAINRLKKDQTKEGLIKDALPRYHEDARDLTYHQYMMACLARSLDLHFNSNLLKVFLKGIRFSLSTVTPDGEVAYLGRCANNVYHSASAIYAFEFASTLKEIEEVERGQFKNAARKIFAYIRPWQRDDGSFPTALNSEFERRMGWSHCRTPYNALTAYFLSHASKIQQESLKAHPLPMEVRHGKYFRHFSESGMVVCSTPSYYVVLFSGAKPSYWWSQGAHRSGLHGIAILGEPGKGSITGSLSESNSHFEIVETDRHGFKEISVSKNEVVFLDGGRQIYRFRFMDETIHVQISPNHQGVLYIAFKPPTSERIDGRFIGPLYIDPSNVIQKVGRVPNPSGWVDLWRLN